MRRIIKYIDSRRDNDIDDDDSLLRH